MLFVDAYIKQILLFSIFFLKKKFLFNSIDFLDTKEKEERMCQDDK
jgi:hypothetical protein